MRYWPCRYHQVYDSIICLAKHYYAYHSNFTDKALYLSVMFIICLYIIFLLLYCIIIYVYIDDQMEAESQLHSLLDSIPSSLPNSNSRSWTERMERSEQSWESQRPKIYEKVISSMALLNETVSYVTTKIPYG